MKRSKSPAKSRSTTPTEKRRKPAGGQSPAKSKVDDSKTKSRSRATPVPMRDDGREPTDVARDDQLRDDLQKETPASPGDRHRQRLTAVEPEEDGVAEDDDDEREEADMRKQALATQAADDEADEEGKPA